MIYEYNGKKYLIECAGDLQTLCRDIMECNFENYQHEFSEWLLDNKFHPYWVLEMVRMYGYQHVHDGLWSKFVEDHLTEGFFQVILDHADEIKTVEVDE